MSVQEYEPPRSLKSRLLSPLWALYNARIITVEPVMFLFILFDMVYTSIIEQYYYQYYGEVMLKNTSFLPPNGSYCINSSLIDDSTGINNSYKQDETKSNDLVIYTQLACKVPSIVTAVIMGPVTDRFGRRIGILLPALGFLTQGIASVLFINFNVNPYYFIPVRFFTGVTGDFTTLIAACFAYVADNSSIKWRSMRLAAVGGALGFGKMVGVLGGGYWLAKVNCDFIPVMIFETAVMGFLILYTLCLPESYPKSEQGTASLWRKESFLNKYIDGIKLFCTGSSYKTWALIVLTATLPVLVLSMEGMSDLAVYFLKAKPFEFSPLQIGYYVAARGGVQGICNVLFFVLVLCNVRDSWIVLAAMTISGTCNMLTGFANKVWELYTISTIQGLEAIVFSAGRGMASKLVKPEQQGSLFSIIASGESLSALVASTIWPYIFPITLKHNLRPGTTFMFIAAVELVMIPFLLSVACLDGRKTTNKRKEAWKSKEYSSVDKSGRSSLYSSSSSEEEEYKPLLTNNNKQGITSIN